MRWLALGLLPFLAGAADYDVLIRNARIIDGSGNPWFRADVATKDGRIAAVGRLGNRSAAHLTERKQAEIAYAPGRGFNVMSWNAREQIILTCSEKRNPGPYAWQVAPNGTGFRRVLPKWDRPHDLTGPTSDGRFMLLSSGGALWTVPAVNWRTIPWATAPAQITFGNPDLFVPYRTRGGRFFTLGVVRLGELQRFDPITRVWQRHLDGISADCVEYSRDGAWVAYVRYPERSLWRCRADGTQCLQLAEGRLGAHLPHWSPDGKTIVFNTNAEGELWRIWLVNADGSDLHPAARSYAGGQLDPAWTADGTKIVFNTGNLVERGQRFLQILDIKSGQITKMPGTDGLWSVKSSPDGSRLLALSSDKERPGTIMILDPATGEWKTASDEPASYPNWAADNKSIVFAGTEGIRRFRLDTWTAETVVRIERVPDIFANLGHPWVGQDRDGNPLVMRNRDVTQVYEIEFQSK